MMPAINFTGGLICGLVVGVGLSVVALFLFGGFANAMGARTRMHKASAYPVAIKVLEQYKATLNPYERQEVEIAVGIMKTSLEQDK